jgi:hypothetical protein
MERVKNQHYVPQFYLRNFQSEHERLFVYDKLLRKSFMKPIKDVASTNYFYEIDPKLLPADAPFQLVEKALSQIEGAAKKTITDTLDNLDQTSVLLPAHKLALAPYVALQAVRTNEFRLTASEFMEKLATNLAEIHLNLKFPGEELPEFEISANDQVLRFQQAQQMFGDMTKELTEILDSHIWVIGRNMTTQPLFASDNPVVKFPHIKDSLKSMAGFGSRGVEVVFPISSRYVISMFERKYHLNIQGMESQVIDLRLDNVEHYNAMQVQQCERQVFASEDKFELCARILREHPDVGDKARPRIVINPNH